MVHSLGERVRVDELEAKALARGIEALYRTEFLHPFPHEECKKIQKLRPDLAGDLVDHLVFYLEFIAGFSSSATRLRDRSTADLRAALPFLKHSFYDEYPQYQPLSQLITEADTPSLSHELATADRLRHDLMTLINQTCSAR